ncbi:MAG TPA: tyrosine-type recombinase/integrase [Alphaproteobacteria bacterium]|nr:tyrosine-type recombinase/integrase [Alphaproteobacteria bacterium]
MIGCRPLADEEISAVLAQFGGRTALRDRALFVLGIRTGYRISELLSLTVGDVWQHGRVVDRVSVARRHMKGKTQGRTVLLHPEAKDAIASWLAEQRARGVVDPKTPLFTSRQGSDRAMTRVRAHQILTAAFDAAGLTGKLATHSMRKTFAHRMYERLGRDLLKLQRAMGHRNINDTVRYLSFREEEIDAAILEG